MNAYAYRTDFDGTPWYVSQLPAKKGSKRALRDGVGWGYTSKIEGNNGLDKAIPLTPYWARRFRCETRRAGHYAYFILI